MRTLSTVPFIFLLVVGVARAEVPRKPSNASYAHLWNNSPFTSKPPPAVQGEQVSAFDDWALGGVSEIEGGYMITLQHKKNAEEKQVISPRGTMKYFADRMEEVASGASGSFKVDRVEFGKGSWMDTVVHLSAGGRTGTVKFDEKTTTPKAAAAPAQNRPPNQQGQPQQPQLQLPGQQPQQGQQPVRPPRPRVAQPAPARR